MTHISFQSYDLKISSAASKRFIYDIARKKTVPLTPEELVRQTVLHYLIYTQKISASLIAVERKLRINGQDKRFDVVLFDRNGKPLLLIECKAPDVKLNADTFVQSGHYNSQLEAQLVWLTNGKTNFVFHTHDLSLLAEMPVLADWLEK